MAILPTHFIGVALVIFIIGLVVVIARRNTIAILMGIELMLNAVNLVFLAFNKMYGGIELGGQIFALFIIAVAAAEAIVGIALVLAIYRSIGTVDIDKLTELRG